MQSTSSSNNSAISSTLRITGEPTLERVAEMVVELRTFLVGKVATAHADAIELGLTEALTNIVRHGFSHVKPRAIEVHCDVHPEQVVIDILDGGSPLPPDALAAADGSVFDFDPDNVDALPEGGMGLSLIKAVFEEVSYAQREHFNRLTLVKDVRA